MQALLDNILKLVEEDRKLQVQRIKDGDNYRIDHLRMNKNQCEFGVNGDEAGAWLFRYLVTAEIGADAHAAWQAYLNAWEMLNEKYKK